MPKVIALDDEADPVDRLLAGYKWVRMGDSPLDSASCVVTREDAFGGLFFGVYDDFVCLVQKYLQGIMGMYPPDDVPAATGDLRRILTEYLETGASQALCDDLQGVVAEHFFERVTIDYIWRLPDDLPGLLEQLPEYIDWDAMDDDDLNPSQARPLDLNRPGDLAVVAERIEKNNNNQ